MNWIKGIISFLRAVINAPEMQHWIVKYEEAKRDNDDLRKTVKYVNEREVKWASYSGTLRAEKENLESRFKRLMERLVPFTDHHPDCRYDSQEAIEGSSLEDVRVCDCGYLQLMKELESDKKADGQWRTTR